MLNKQVRNPNQFGAFKFIIKLIQSSSVLENSNTKSFLKIKMFSLSDYLINILWRKTTNEIKKTSVQEEIIICFFFKVPNIDTKSKSYF